MWVRVPPSVQFCDISSEAECRFSKPKVEISKFSYRSKVNIIGEGRKNFFWTRIFDWTTWRICWYYIFFTDDYFNAEGYSNDGIVYEVYLSIKKPLIINCQDKLETPYGLSWFDVLNSKMLEQFMLHFHQIKLNQPIMMVVGTFQIKIFFLKLTLI